MNEIRGLFSNEWLVVPLLLWLVLAGVICVTVFFLRFKHVRFRYHTKKRDFSVETSTDPSPRKDNRNVSGGRESREPKKTAA